ncbi:Signal transduction histidine kinase regulating C4-dicarboxylate transport system [Hydrogenophaga sp. T4]|nr:Signal transduction histidine kinase regulating C4-dicarboxylate transport system [Hydrogenophaga sp. T4]
MAVLGQLAASITHELTQPLGGIRTLSGQRGRVHAPRQPWRGAGEPVHRGPAGRPDGAHHRPAQEFFAQVELASRGDRRGPHRGAGPVSVPAAPAARTGGDGQPLPARAVDRLVRCQPAGAGAGQPGRQRAGCHARRAAQDPADHRRTAAGAGAAGHRHPCAGQWQGPERGRLRPPLRAVLHHQGQWRRLGAGSGDLPRYCRRIQWRPDGAQRPGRGACFTLTVPLWQPTMHPKTPHTP